MSNRPPFRADEVGSLLRPAAIKQARENLESGKIDAPQLRAIEDESIRGVVKRQESVGLKGVTDGELRRAWWHFDFLTGLEGVEWSRGTKSIQFQGKLSKTLVCLPSMI